jgi:hypothetical protein
VNVDVMKRRAFALFVLSAIVTLGAASPARADDWSSAGLDSAHGRLSAEHSGATFADGRWSFKPSRGAPVVASPVVAEGFVVSVDLAGVINVVQAEDGLAVWRLSTGMAVQGTPAIVNGRLFVPTSGNKLLGLALATGAPLWSLDVGGMILSSPTPIDGDIVVAAGFPLRTVIRVAGATGQIVWQSPPVMEQFSNSSPVVGGGLVVVAANSGHTYAFDAATGTPRWDYLADGIVNLAGPLIAGGRVYLAGGDLSDQVHAVDLATGTALPGWPIALPTPDPDVAGTRLGRQRAVSSPVSAGGLLILETRLDDSLDTDGDGIADEILSREIVVALDPTTGALAWQHALARALVTDPNDVPKLFVCPPPAAFSTDAGPPLLAVGSSLAANLFVIDVATGSQRAVLATAASMLAGPVMANGRLVTIAIDGTIEGSLSSVNHPPSAPIAAANPRPLSDDAVTLRWLPAVDPDGELSTTELRIDTDGEILQTWQQRILLGAGVTSTPLGGPFLPGVTYTFALRAQDPHGALSPWSAPQTFTVVTNPPVLAGGTVAKSLQAALAAAQPGDVVLLGAGTYTLSETAHVGAGVAVQGAGAGRTIFDATGLPVGLRFDGTAAGHPAGLDGVTIHGADICLQVGAGATGVELGHLIVRDCPTSGISVEARGGASVVNATVVGNGIGVQAGGTTTIKNSLLTANRIALAGDTPGTLSSRYDDLFGNQSASLGVAVGTGDFAEAVTFVDLSGRDLRLASSQPSTDKGDPADAVAFEPEPNGARINLGAFGGTADAEESAVPTAVDSPNDAGAPAPITNPNDAGAPAPSTTPAGDTSGAAGSSGCAVAGAAGRPGPAALLLLLTIVWARRPARRRRDA